MFGRGRSQVGVLLELNHEAMPTAEDKERFRDIIWSVKHLLPCLNNMTELESRPVIEELNRDALKHAPISKQVCPITTYDNSSVSDALVDDRLCTTVEAVQLHDQGNSETRTHSRAIPGRGRRCLRQYQGQR